MRSPSTRHAVLVGLGALALATLSGGRAAAGTISIASPSDDTFINAGNPGNNNGGSASIFTGTDGHDNVMRGLIRFGLPTSFQGRAIVTEVQLRLTLRALGDGTAGAPALLSLQAITQPWTQGNGVGDVPSAFTVGEPCGGTVTGATWLQTNCALGVAWTTPGGSVATVVSGTSNTAGLSVGAPVVWDSASNAGMNADVQSWLDAPAGNAGWRITSDTEGSNAQAQRFFSSEAGTSVPTLTVTYACKAGFQDTGTSCVAEPPAVPAAAPPARAMIGVALGALGLLAHRRRRTITA
jgi:hypothetical protein